MRRLILALTASTALVSAAALAQTESTTQQPPAAETTATQDLGATQGQLTVQNIRSQQISGQSGEIGQVVDVVADANGKNFVIVALGPEHGNRQVAIPLERISHQDNRFTLINVTDDQLKALPAFEQGQAGLTPLQPDMALNIAGSQQPEQQAAATDQQGTEQATGDGGNIVLQQPAPTIQVEQGTPQITVQQPTPDVTVHQPQPEIIVRQVPPTITVDMPQPEIIVRMPEPTVDVAMAQPQVQVKMPKPQVQVVQPEQPQVQVSEAEQSQVAVTKSAQKAQVTVNRAQPTVRFERTGQPKIVFNESQEQPKVTYEQMAKGDQPADQAGQQDAQQLTQQPEGQTGQQSGEKVVQLGTGETTQTGGTDQTAQTDQTTQATGTEQTGATTNVRAIMASQLEGQNVYNLNGDELGEVNDVLIDANKKVFLVVEYGGFLGLGERRVLLPMEQFAMRGDRLIIPNMTEDQLKAQSAWDQNMEGYQAAERDFRTDLNLVQ